MALYAKQGVMDEIDLDAVFMPVSHFNIFQDALL